MKKLILLTVFVLFNIILLAQNSAYPNKFFVIILSTKNYVEAKKLAIKASEVLGLQLNLRAMYPNKKIGLSYPKAQALEIGDTFPYATPRGLENDENYVSVEYSSHYKGFAKGFYIVVASVFIEKDAAEIAMVKIKEKYKTAYTKQTKVGVMDFTK